jgi:hypothetical protein
MNIYLILMVIFFKIYNFFYGYIFLLCLSIVFSKILSYPYACIREGPDHAPIFKASVFSKKKKKRRFKASVNFNGEIFESPM